MLEVIAIILWKCTKSQWHADKPTYYSTK